MDQSRFRLYIGGQVAEPLRQVGRYDLLEVIGRGGAAVVYLAHQPDLDRQVALKELAPHHASDPSFAQRFVEESRLAAAMNNPSIVTVYEFFEHEGLPYIAMEYLPHGSLRRYLQDLSGAQLGGVLESVLEGLAYGEQMGIVHRDLKPENLLVGANGRVKIADFGVARALSSASPRAFATITGTPIGTPAYMAPEQALGQPLTAAADLYSLGIVTWEALAGRTPFGSSDTPMAVLYQQVHEPIPPIESIRDDVHPGASRWVGRMLAKAPEERYASAQEAWDELEEVLIEMLGPRWRREASLTLDGEPPAPELTAGEPHPTTDSGRSPAFALPSLPEPAESHTFDGFEDVDSGTGLGGGGGDAEDGVEEDLRADDDRRRPQVAAVLTAEPQSAPRPDVDPAFLVLPAVPVKDDLHSFRTAAIVPERSRRESRPVASGRGRWLVAGLLSLIAAGAGVLIGEVSSPGAPATKLPITTTSPSAHLALEVRPIITALSRAHQSQVHRFDTARTQKAQAAAAADLSARYRAVDRQLSHLPASARGVPAFVAVLRDVRGLSNDWHAVAQDASHNRRRRYAATVRTIEAAQKRLVSDAATAERG